MLVQGNSFSRNFACWIFSKRSFNFSLFSGEVERQEVYWVVQWRLAIPVEKKKRVRRQFQYNLLLLLVVDRKLGIE